MYSNDFVVAILVNGQFADESVDGQVGIPANSEYVIRLRNKNNKRALAKVFIDNEPVTEGGIVVDAQSYVDLERPTTKAVKFKFVSSESGEAIDFGKNNKTDGSNGVIRVEWQLEREYIPPVPVYKPMIPSYSSFRKGGPCGQSMSGNYAEEEYCKGGLDFADYGGSRGLKSPKLSEGCTVEGGRSSQSFSYTNFYVDGKAPVIIQFVLRVLNERPVVKEGIYCQNCGKRGSLKAKFCNKCGSKLC